MRIPKPVEHAAANASVAVPPSASPEAFVPGVGRLRPRLGRILCEALRREASKGRANTRRETKSRRQEEALRIPTKERTYASGKRYKQQTAERFKHKACARSAARRNSRPTAACAIHAVKSAARLSVRATQRAKPRGSSTEEKTPKMCRRIARKKSKERFHARRDAGLCTRCGQRPLVAGSTTCEPCSDVRRAADREQYDKRRAEGLCGRCGEPTDGGSRCAQCAMFEAGRYQQKNATARRLYARRRARRCCTDCGAPSQGASRCPECCPPLLYALGRTSRLTALSRRATPSSKSRRAKITAHSKVGPM